MFEKILYNIISELDNFKTPSEVFESCVSKKLDDQMNSYAKEVDMLCDYLLKRDSKKVLRRVALNHKLEEKENGSK